MTRTAIDKRDATGPAKVEVLTKAKGGNYPPGKMLVSTPLEIEAIVRRIPEGRVLTLGALRAALARSHKADYTCPITTGIFLRIVGEAAEEERAAGKTAVTPYWRVVRDDGTLIDKLPGGDAAQARRLEREDVHVMHLGARRRLSDVDHYAWSPPPLKRSARPR
ncbi:MAG: MGMT family protein [Kofleriaceae bacterium]|nr:MAG: MGMT family protein [Kofleriaceae bacterium]